MNTDDWLPLDTSVCCGSCEGTGGSLSAVLSSSMSSCSSCSSSASSSSCRHTAHGTYRAVQQSCTVVTQQLQGNITQTQHSSQVWPRVSKANSKSRTFIVLYAVFYVIPLWMNVQYCYSNSVCLSVHDMPVLYQNSRTYHQTLFFTAS